MEREHTVGLQMTNGAECICNPEILFGTKYGLWNIKKEIAPRGTLLDLNAAWELFLSRKGLQNLSFDEHEHQQHEIVPIYNENGEVIGQQIFEEGDITYTLLDDNGNPTGATFTIKANKGPIEHIEWEQGNLILYYTKIRPVTQEDVESGVPLHYVLDENGNKIIDSETGQYLIYEYVKVPVIEIFDNDETHKLFPWFADDQHTVRLRQNLDDPEDLTSSHLGDFAVTQDSEVFVAKQPYEENQGNTLVSIQSLYEQLKKDLGFEPTYTPIATINSGAVLTEGQANLVNSELGTNYQAGDTISSTDATAHNSRVLVDQEGNSIHERATGSTLSEVLNTSDATSLVDAINSSEDFATKLHQLIDGHTGEVEDGHDLGLNSIFDNGQNIDNIVAALNLIQASEIGNWFTDKDSRLQSTDIVNAINEVLTKAINNRDRIGFSNGNWIQLSTDHNQNLTEAINEVDTHTNALASQVGLTENANGTGYNNDSLNLVTKERLNNPNSTIIQDINELQAQIGNLSQNASGISSIPELKTDSKESLVLAINEVDTHTDNNYNAIGATYQLDATGNKTGNITNLTHPQADIVTAINRLDGEIGDLSTLTTDSNQDLVSAINEVISEQPFILYDPSNPGSGILSKNNNHGTVGKYSFTTGRANTVNGNYSISGGASNSIKGNYSVAFGNTNIIYDSSVALGTYNVVATGDKRSNNYIIGNENAISGQYNYILGQQNTLNDESFDIIALGSRNVIHCDTIGVLGHDNNVLVNSRYGYILGEGNTISGDYSIAVGANNSAKDNSVVIGHNNTASQQNNYHFGANNSSNGQNNILIGQNQTITGNNNTIISSKNLDATANNAIVIGDKITEVKSNAVTIGRDIYIQTHGTQSKPNGVQSKLQRLIAVDLNDWCKENNAAPLTSGYFLTTTHVVQALGVYCSQHYDDEAILRFTMLDNNSGQHENGFILVQGNSIRLYLKGCWFYTNNMANGWNRHEGEYLKVIHKTEVDGQGNQVVKHYLAFMDQLSTLAQVDRIGPQRSNDYDNVHPEDFGSIDLNKAYGAVPFTDINDALNLDNRFNEKVDKTAQIITTYYDANGVQHTSTHNFVDPLNSAISSNITLDLEQDFGLRLANVQLKSEKGQPNGYTPLNAQGTIDAQYLPSYVDDVIDVWADYQVDSRTGAVINTHLYEIVTSVDPQTGETVYSRGLEYGVSKEAETGKIYVEADPEVNKPFSVQFRWTGSQFVPIGFSNLVIGEITGTAFDGGRGKAVEDALSAHERKGIETIQVEQPDGTYVSQIKDPNPHHVTTDQIDVIIQDANNPHDIPETSPNSGAFQVTVHEALQEIFDRMNELETQTNPAYSIIGTVAEMQEFDALDGQTSDNTPTILGFLLALKPIPLSASDDPSENDDENIDYFVNSYFKFEGELAIDEPQPQD